jgi:transposase
MIRGGFLTEEDRGKLVALVRDGSAASRVTRRANALVLLDGGWSCREVAAALLMDDDTIRGWHKLFEQRGIEGLTSFDMGGSAGFLSTGQEDALKAYVGATLPRSTRRVGAWIEQEFGLVYESRSGLIALLHRLGLQYHKPNVIPAKLDEDKQKAFIENYEKLLNSLGDTRPCCSRTRCIRPMRRGLPAAGHQNKRSSRSNRRAGAIGSIFTARSTSRPDRPG